MWPWDPRPQAQPVPEIGADDDAPFEENYEGLIARPCDELKTLSQDIDSLVNKLAEAGFRGVKEVSLIFDRGSNFVTDVDEGLKFLRGQKDLVADEMVRKRCGS